MRERFVTAVVTIVVVLSQVGALQKRDDCEVPQEFSNGRLRTVQKKFRDRPIVPTGILLQFKCDEGYVLTGPLNVTCADGSWTPQFPVCSPLVLTNDSDCEIPKKFSNGKLRPVEREYRDRSAVPTGIHLQFKCEKEYMLTRADIVVCANGSWVPELPICAPVPCNECCEVPEEFTNGQIIVSHRKLRGRTRVAENSILMYACDPGYELSATNGSFCLQGRWHPEIPRCIRNSCPQPPPLEHGRVVPDFEQQVFPLGSNVSYTCDEDYQLVQEASLTCAEGFLWEGEMPQCKEIVRCKDPDKDTRAQREGQCCEIGDVLKYSCIEEYEIVGPSAIVCTEAGTWNDTRPRCQPKDLFCDVPDEISKGQILFIHRNGSKILRQEEQFFFPDDEIMIVCDKGYTVGNQSDFLVCEEDGRWDDRVPECEPFRCNIPEPPENGHINELEENANLSTVSYDFEINFACSPGYRLIGDSWRVCTERGWSTKNPRCEEIRCPNPGQPENGWMRGTDFRIGNATYFGCYSGYNLLGSHRRVCMENGQWNGEMSRCDREGSYCPNPGTPIGGRKTGSRYDLGSEVEFECNPGRMLIGSASRMCQRNKEWSGQQPKCLSENDFDDKRAVGVRIRTFLHDARIEYEVPRGRAIDLDLPGRLVFVFIFDVSGSVGEANFKKSIRFTKALVRAIKMDGIGARVGVITFSSKAGIEINPEDHDDEKSLFEALDNIEYKKGGTATSSALNLLKVQMMPLTIQNFGKDSRFKVFLMTDGKANMAGNPMNEAAALKDDGVEIFCIGITGDRNMKTLRDIASSKEEHVFVLDNYESMDWLVQQIVNEKVDYSKCGVRMSVTEEPNGKEDERKRTIGGKVVVKNWSWMAIVFTVDPKDNDIDKAKRKNLCGGSLVSKKWVLTAAHCMHHGQRKEKRFKKKDEFVIYLGIRDLTNTTTLKKHLVAGYITHPSYSKDTYDYDIAMMELSPPAAYNEFIRPICLPPSANDLDNEPEFYLAGKKVVAVGWGHDKPVKEKGRKNFRTVNVANELVIPLQKRAVCSNSLRNHPDYIFTDQMICAGENGKDTCQGDSGGPLMMKRNSDIGEEYWSAIGIVSWGVGCAQPGMFGFYTKVSLFTDWIEDIMQKEYCKNGDVGDAAVVCHY